MSLKLYKMTEDGKIAESGWFEPEESRKKRDNGWVTDPKKFKMPKEDLSEVEIDIDAELERLRKEAKDIGYSYYKKAKKEKLIEVLKNHKD